MRQRIGVLSSRSTSQTTGVEGTQGQLCTRLADSLSGNHADSLALLHHESCSKVTTVALGAQAVFSLAGEDRTDLHFLDTGALDSVASTLANLFAGSNDQYTVLIEDVVYAYSTEDTLRERSYYGVVLLDSASNQATERTTVLLGDDHIVRYVNKTTGQITGIGSLQSGIGKTLTGTVGRNEVLQHAHAFLEVSKHRVFDRGTCVGRSGFLRFTHQATDTSQLLDLLFVTTRTRIHHHIYGVESLVGLLHVFHQDVCNLVVDTTPCVNDLVVTLVVGHLTEVIALGDSLDFCITFGDKVSTLLRNKDVVEVETQTALECHVVTEVLDVVEELSRTGYTAGLDNLGDDVLDSTFLEYCVLETDLLRHVLINHYTPRSGLDDMLRQLTVNHLLDTYAHLGVDIHSTLVQGDGALLLAIERQSFALHAGALLGDVIQTKNHVLRRNGDRITVSRVKDVVRAEHQQLCLEDSLVAQRKVYSHLVTIEVGVETGAGQRVQLNSLTLDHLRLERQYTMTVQCRCTVEQYGVTFHHMLQDLKDNRITAVDDLLG